MEWIEKEEEKCHKSSHRKCLKALENAERKENEWKKCSLENMWRKKIQCVDRGVVNFWNLQFLQGFLLRKVSTLN